MSYQHVTIVGNLGKDPETRFTPGGTEVANFSVATNRKYTGSDGQTIKETCWFNVSVMGKQANACATYLHKGSQVLVTGRLTPDKTSGGPRVWTRADGITGASYDLFADTVRFLDSKPESSGQQQEDNTEPEF